MIHVRNLRCPAVANTRCVTLWNVVLRELFQIARWTVAGDDGGGRWGGNVTVDEPGGANGYAVNPASPRVVYDPAGRFTSSMVTNVAMLALRAANDQNRSMWRITEFVDANHVKVDPLGENPDNWLAETGIPGRVIEVDTWLLANDYTLLNAPSPSRMQFRLLAVDTQYAKVFIRPRGQDGFPAEVSGIQTPSYYYGRQMWFNLVADGPNVYVWAYCDIGPGTAELYGLAAVDLDEAATGDNRKSMLMFQSDVAGTYPHAGTCQMLDGGDATVSAYLDWIKPNWASTVTDGIYRKPAARLVNGGVAPIRSPHVWLGNVGTGGYRRGKMPAVFATTNAQFDRDRGLDAAGDWLHIAQGIAVPRRGPDDPLPIRPL